MRLLYIAILASFCFGSCAKKGDYMCRCCADWGDCADYHLVKNKAAAEARDICNAYSTASMYCDINKVKEGQ